MNRYSKAKLASGLTLLCAFAVATTHPTLGAQGFAVLSCALPTACDGGNNTSSGPGVQGTSALGTGVVAQTKCNSTSSANGKPALLGQDLSTTGAFDEG